MNVYVEKDASYLFGGRGFKKVDGRPFVLRWFFSNQVQDFLSESDSSGLSLGSGYAQLAWLSLQHDHKKRCLLTLLGQNPFLLTIYVAHHIAVSNNSFKKARQQKEEEERARLLNRVLTFLSQTSVTMTILFLFANKVSASDFPGNSFPNPNGSFQNAPLVLEPTVQEKQRLLLRKVALLAVAVGTLGAVGYLLSSRAVPYFIRLAPRLKETLVPPVLDVLTVLPALPGLEILEFIPVPSFLTGPFSQRVSTLGVRIDQALDFFSVLEADPAFLLQRYRAKTFQMIELMADHIDNLAVLSVLSRQEEFKPKMALLHDAFAHMCFKNKAIESYCFMMRKQTLNNLTS